MNDMNDRPDKHNKHDEHDELEKSEIQQTTHLRHALTPRQYKPTGWLDHQFQKNIDISLPREAIWAWLTDPRSFTRQVFPWRVEFTETDQISEQNKINQDSFTSGGFKPGVLNIHHGPLIHFAGVNTEINNECEDIWRRDLHYFYGSFAINFRLIRPTRLLFELDQHDNQSSSLKLTVSSYVRGPKTARAWSGMQSLFWSTFPSAIRSGAKKKMKSANTDQNKGRLVHG